MKKEISRKISFISGLTGGILSTAMLFTYLFSRYEPPLIEKLPVFVPAILIALAGLVAAVLLKHKPALCSWILVLSGSVLILLLLYFTLLPDILLILFALPFVLMILAGVLGLLSYE